MNKKGQMQTALFGLLTLAIFLVVVGYITAFGQDFTDQTRTSIQNRNLAANCGQNSTGGSGGVISYTNCGVAYNATKATLDSLSTVASGQGTVATVGILVIIVGLLVGVIAVLGFAGRRQDHF